MLDKNSVAIMGYSGHAYVVLEAAQLMGLRCSAYCERSQAVYNPYNLNYIGFEGENNFNWDLAAAFILGIGENVLRSKIGNLIRSRNKELLNVVHPSAIISSTAEIGKGVFIGTNAIIHSLASIGNYCILNSASIIEHECRIGNAVHIAPAAVLTGNVSIGENSFIGANSVIRQGVEVGQNVIIGAGSTVINNIPNHQVWVGNPARRIK